MTSTHDHDAAEPDWEAMYRDTEQHWSGHVNGSLVVEVDAMPPGRALDVGCGEGADAIWLAERGWQVTAADVAPTAVERGAAEAERRGLRIDWLAGDVLVERPPAGAFDLVAMHYPAFAIERLDDAIAMLTESVAPGGTLLAVGHARPSDPDAVPWSWDDWVQPRDLPGRLGDAWTIEVHEHRPRVGDHHHGSPHTEDVVVRARLRADPSV